MKLTRYGYDAKGNRLRVEDFSGVRTTYTYDAQDRLKTVGLPSGTTTYSYFEDGLTRGTAHFNGMHEARRYDAAGRLLGLTTSRTAAADGCAPTEYVSRQRYTYDEEGNRLTQQEEVTQAEVRELTPLDHRVDRRGNDLQDRCDLAHGEHVVGVRKWDHR